MCNLSENYYLRKCFLQREQVPTQSTIKKKMSPPLAAVYFNSMTPRLKQLAGLEPLQGAGSNWYIPPEELLQGRAVMKPVEPRVLKMLNHQGISALGTTLFLNHRREMDLQIEKTLIESDISWKNAVQATTRQLWDDLVAKATQRNSERIMKDFNSFAYLYRQSIGKIEILFHESAVAEIRNNRQKSLHAMQNKYENYLKIQATAAYEEYEKKLKDEQTRLKDEFMHTLEVSRTTMSDKIHDHKVEKHKAVEIMRKCMQCQNLACQIYVALKEREECLKETEELKYEHKKIIKDMQDTILTKDVEIHIEKVKEEARKKFYNIWQRKVCHVVKSFQMFVLYCLNMLPEYAEFFINMEKLMLLQLNETLEDPNAASIFEVVEEESHDPVPDLRPFYLFCDKGDKPVVDRKLCPKHSVHSSASDIPAMVINKRCLYAACDNFTQFTDKIISFIQGNRGDDADFKDDVLFYEHLIPVKYETSQRLLEVKLESSLLQVLQDEIVDMRVYKANDPNECNCETLLQTCQHCRDALSATPVDDGEKTKPEFSRAPQLTVPPLGKIVELDHETEPKWDSYCRHVNPKKCTCAKTAKKHLEEHLPSYMRHMTYGPPEIPGYEMCSTIQLKALVRNAKKGIPPVPVPATKYIGVKDMATQYSDLEYDELCNCYSQDELNKFIEYLKMPIECTSSMRLVGARMSSSYLERRPSAFAMDRAHSLKNLVEDVTDLKTIFKKGDCFF